jgi:hypothetical protein
VKVVPKLEIVEPVDEFTVEEAVIVGMVGMVGSTADINDVA